MAEVKIIEVKVNVGDAIKTIDALEKEITQLTAAQKANKRGTDEERQAYIANSIQIKEYQNQKRILTREVLTEVKSSQQAIGAYQKLQIEYTKAAQKAKDLAAGNTATANEIKKATDRANALGQKLKDIDKSIGQHQRNVGDYQQAMSGLGGRFGMLSMQMTTYNNLLAGGLTGLKPILVNFGAALKTLFLNPIFLIVGAIVALGAAIKGLVTNAMEFQKTMANVKAVSGATNAEFQALKQNAKDLGASTAKTATEIAQLQVEFAKLGFTAAEILKVTEGTVSLSLATGASLARSAEVAGSTLRGFNLDAAETNRVTDVMAKSFSTSALDMEKFAESMKYVAPNAYSANVSLEETTAMLAVLANNGISGSMAGTSLRKILVDLRGESGTLTEKLARLNEKGLDLGGAFDEVGRTAMTSLLVLSRNADKLPELTEAFENAGGSAKEMADIMNDTLTGDITILESAWDGLMLAIEDGEGVLSKMSRYFIQGLTKILEFAKIYVGSISDAFSWVFDQINHYFIIPMKLAGEAVVQSFKAMGTAFEQVKNGEFKAALQTMKDMKKAFDQTTSMENINRVYLAGKAQKEHEKSIRAAAKAMVESEEEAKKAFEENEKQRKIREEAEKKAEAERKKRFEAQLKAMTLSLEKMQLENEKRTERAIIDEWQAELKILEFKKLTAEEEYNEKLKLQKKYGDELTKLQDNQIKKAKEAADAIVAATKKALDESLAADIAAGDEDIRIMNVKRQNQLNFFDDKYALAKGNIDAMAALEKEAIDRQMREELRAEALTQEQRTAITEKAAKARKEIDQNAFSAKLDMAQEVTQGLAELFGKETAAGKFAAAASVAIESYQMAFKTGAQAAAYFASGNIPMGVLASAQTGIIVAKGIKSIADIYKVDDNVESKSGADKGATTQVTEKFHSGGLIQGDGEVPITALGGESVMNTTATKLFSPILSSLNMMGGGKAITAGVGSAGLGQEMLTVAFAKALQQMPAPVMTWKEYENQRERMARLENNRIVQ